MEKESDEESDENEDIDTTDMPDLESQESIKGKGLNPASISCFPRRLQHNTFRLPRTLKDVLKTFSRRICYTSF